MLPDEHRPTRRGRHAIPSPVCFRPGHTVTDGLCPAENGFILHNGYNAVATEGTAAQRHQVTCQDPERDPGPGDSEASSFLLNSQGPSHFINMSFSLRSATDQEFSHVLLAPGAYRAAAPGGCIVGDRPPRSWLPKFPVTLAGHLPNSKNGIMSPVCLSGAVRSEPDRCISETSG